MDADEALAELAGTAEDVPLTEAAPLLTTPEALALEEMELKDAGGALDEPVGTAEATLLPEAKALLMTPETSALEKLALMDADEAPA